MYYGKGKVDYNNLEALNNPDLDKISYDGEFVRGLYHGRGKLVYFVGDNYEGDFFKGKRQGKGILTFKMKTDIDTA